MRAINVFLSVVVSVLLGLLVLELGLRALGKGPQPTINRFDPDTGWSKTPGAKSERKTGEFHVHYEINELGLRDDKMPSPKKPANTFRVLMLGDSFVLGYTVERRDLFVDLLEDWWKAEGRAVDVVNTGTEGWSTDQEVAWLEKNGASFEPDVVILFPYENDLYWNSQPKYRRFPKPRYTPFGNRLQENLTLHDPGPKPWHEHTALGAVRAAMRERRVTWQHEEGRPLEMEYGAYFVEPPGFMVEAVASTRGALLALRSACERMNAKLYVAPIPGKVAIDPKAKEMFARTLHPKLPDERWKIWQPPTPIDPAAWSPDKPVETFLALAKELSLPTLDARPALRAAQSAGEPLYFARDWHLNPHGNRVFAKFLHDELDRMHAFPEKFAAKNVVSMPVEEAPARMPGWLPWFVGLWVALTVVYSLTYKDEPWWKAAVGVGCMLALVFTLAVGGGALLDKLPPPWPALLIFLLVSALLIFIFVKLGRRVGTILELFTAFTRRGHWYLMPLVVVLLSIGSLLVVAASSPLIAPFIYTLF